MIKINKTKIKNRRLLYLTVLAIFVLIGSFFVYEFVHNNNENPTSPVVTNDGIKYEPATEQEKSEAEQNKENIVKQDKNQSSQQTNIRTVDIVISSALQNQSSRNIEVRGYAKTFNESGTCILTLTRGIMSVSTSGPATQNVSTMSCGKLTIDRSKLSSGTWVVMLSYQSAGISGKTSQQIEVK